MFRRFLKPEVSTPEKAEEAAISADRAEAAARGVQSGVAAATAIGLTALAASGPALPVIAGVGILAAAAAKIYFLNKKLTGLFKRAAGLTSRMLPVIDAVEARNLGLNTSEVREAAIRIQMTIGELIGPQALKEINDARQGPALGTGRSSWMARLNRYGRMVAPAATLSLFNEQLLYLGLEFSVLQGEFAILLDKLPPAQAASVAAAAGTPIDSNTVPASIGAATEGAANPQATATPTGGRTRRRRRARKTRKNSY